MLMSAHSPLMAAAAIIMVGLSYGVELQIFGYLMARYFGLGTFSTLIGIYNFCSTAACAIGMSSFGLTFDRFGSYSPALAGAALCFAVAALLYLTLGRYPTEPGIRAGKTG
jgi:predicted MFS family arabinose efflux permease